MRQRCAMVAMLKTPSIQVKDSPMHWRVPPPHGGEGVGYGFVAGEEDCEDFVTDLVVGHAFGLFAGCGFGVGGFVGAAEKHGEQVALIWLANCGGFSVFGDEAVDDRVEAGF